MKSWFKFFLLFIFISFGFSQETFLSKNNELYTYDLTTGISTIIDNIPPIRNLTTVDNQTEFYFIQSGGQLGYYDINWAGLPPQYILTLHEARAIEYDKQRKRLYIIETLPDSSSRLFTYDVVNQVLTSYNTIGIEIYGIDVAPNGVIYLWESGVLGQTGRGLCTLEFVNRIPIVTDINPQVGPQQVTDIFFDNDGQLWGIAFSQQFNIIDIYTGLSQSQFYVGYPSWFDTIDGVMGTKGTNRCTVNTNNSLVYYGTTHSNNYLELAGLSLTNGPNTPVIFFTGRSQTFIPYIYNNNTTRCIFDIHRFNPVITESNGSVSINLDLNSLPPWTGTSVISGETWYFQAWFVPITTGIPEFSNSIEIQYQ